MLNEIIMQRLAFIRYLYKIGVEQSSQPEPLSSASILTFHDSVELFLQLSSEALDRGKANIDFMAYWELLSPKISGEGLAQKESMRRLNASRVALKHHGTLPSKIDIESHRAAVTNFFEDNTPLVFSISFSEISLVNMVADQTARENLLQAVDFLNQDDNKTAIEITAIAYMHVIEAATKGSSGSYGSIYQLNLGHRFDYSGLGRTSYGGGNNQVPEVIHELAKDVQGRFEGIEKVITIILLGIDYKKYSMFLCITPQVWRTQDGKYHSRQVNAKLPTKENARFCIDFVIECALRIQNL